MKTKVSSTNNSQWTRPGKMNNQEFLAGIEKAEKGRFYTVQESMTNFEQWLKARKNP